MIDDPKDREPTVDEVLRGLRFTLWKMDELEREAEELGITLTVTPRIEALEEVIRQLRANEITSVEADIRMAEIDLTFPE